MPKNKNKWNFSVFLIYLLCARKRNHANKEVVAAHLFPPHLLLPPVRLFTKPLHSTFFPSHLAHFWPFSFFFGRRNESTIWILFSRLHKNEMKEENCSIYHSAIHCWYYSFRPLRHLSLTYFSHHVSLSLSFLLSSHLVSFFFISLPTDIAWNGKEIRFTYWLTEY